MQKRIERLVVLTDQYRTYDKINRAIEFDETDDYGIPYPLTYEGFLVLENNFVLKLQQEWKNAWKLAVNEYTSEYDKIGKENITENIIIKYLLPIFATRLGWNFVNQEAIRELIDDMVFESIWFGNAESCEMLDIPIKAWTYKHKRAFDHWIDDTAYWIGTAYDRRLKETIENNTLDIYNNDDITNDVSMMELEYEQEFEKHNNYWTTIGATAAVGARGWSQLFMFQSIQIIKWIFEAVGDDRTCPICMSLNGLVLDVEMSIEQNEYLLGVDDPELVKDIHPWLYLDTPLTKDKGSPQIYYKKPGSGSRRFYINDKLEKARNGNSIDLQATGAVDPPVHDKCRCRKRPVISFV